MVKRNYLSIIILLFFSVFVSGELYYYDDQQRDSVNIKDFPKTIGRWTSQDLPIDNPDAADLETKNAFLRRYSQGDEGDVYLYIVYSQTNPKATNPPEISYKESGISILDKGKQNIIISPSHLVIKTNWILLEENRNRQLAYYWFKVGGIYTYSYWKQQALAALNNLAGKKTGSALIKISADIKAGNEDRASRLISEFASIIGPQLSSYLP